MFFCHKDFRVVYDAWDEQQHSYLIYFYSTKFGYLPRPFELELYKIQNSKIFTISYMIEKRIAGKNIYISFRKKRKEIVFPDDR